MGDMLFDLAYTHFENDNVVIACFYYFWLRWFEKLINF
jgi:hypothetical protein